jgi:hypothetical protein
MHLLNICARARHLDIRIKHNAVCLPRYVCRRFVLSVPVLSCATRSDSPVSAFVWRAGR